VVSVDEQYLRIRRSLEETLGMEEASYLMDRPVGGWSALVTNHTLDLKFDVIDERFRAVDERFRSVDEGFTSLEHRIDTSIAALRSELMGYMDQRFADLAWRVITAVIAGMAVMAAIFAGVTAGLFAILGT
jgi:hypothetical protein